MPRLIKIDSTKEKVLTHYLCGAKIGYFLNEVIDGGYIPDYGGGGYQYYYIVCPHCQDKITVSNR